MFLEGNVFRVLLLSHPQLLLSLLLFKPIFSPQGSEQEELYLVGAQGSWGAARGQPCQGAAEGVSTAEETQPCPRRYRDFGVPVQ